VSDQKQNPLERPGFVKVVFDYPFHLGLPDAYFPVAIKEEDLYALIKIEPREGAQIYDKGKVLRDEEMGGKRQIGLKDTEDPDKRTMEIVATGENNQPLFHYVAGRNGRALYPWHYCQVEVIFPVNDIYSAWSLPKNSDFIGTMTARLFNRLLVHYRHASNDVHNKLQSEDNDLSFYTTIYISEFSQSEKEQSTVLLLRPSEMEKRTFVPFPMQGDATSPEIVPLVKASVAAPLMTNAYKKEMAPEKTVTFMHGSGGMYEVKIFNEILLAGLERIAMDKDYRVAITEFDTAVEMAVMYYLITLLIKEGKTDQEISQLLDETLKSSRDLAAQGKGYLSTGQRISRLGELFDKYRAEKNLPRTSLFSAEHATWNTEVRKKRNASVHMWQHFKKEDAEKAFHAAQSYIRFIQKIGDEILK